MRRRMWPWMVLGLCAVLCAGGVYLAYQRDMRALSARVTAESKTIDTPHGLVEFAQSGAGPDVLVVHGAGGGYDQGLFIGRIYGGDGFRWIAPSRFGYLRTPLPADASTSAQAEAFAALLDALGIRKVGILAMSGGVPPSLQFAQRYPARVSSLVLLSSAPFTPLTAETQELPVPIWVYQMLFSSDFPYWVLQKLGRRNLETIFDVKPALRATLTPDDERIVAAMVDNFQPVTKRRSGVDNEGAAIDPQTRYALGEIRAPVLVIHARDDGINPFAIAEYTSQHISGAELLPVATGGHLLLGHQAEIQARVNAFFHEHARDPSQ